MPEDRVAPVFPLPDVVFFPRTVLPLHVFEPRYRQMVKDAVASDGRIVVALLQPGWQADYEGSPAYEAVSTRGRIEGLETTRDGRFHLRLVGEERVRLGAVVRERPYRLARYALAPETRVDDATEEIRLAKLDLLASQGCLLRELAAADHPGLVFDEAIPFEAAVNAACAGLPSEPSIRQALLELDDLLERHRRVANLLDDVLQRVLHLKSLRSRDEGGSEIN